eukprot:g20237.t1
MEINKQQQWSPTCLLFLFLVLLRLLSYFTHTIYMLIGVHKSQTPLPPGDLRRGCQRLLTILHQGDSELICLITQFKIIACVHVINNLVPPASETKK